MTAAPTSPPIAASAPAAGHFQSPRASASFEHDCETFSKFWAGNAAALAALPAKPERSGAQQMSASEILAIGRHARRDFLSAHVGTLYRRLTENFTRKHRIEHLARAAAGMVPGLVPDEAGLKAENAKLQKHKDAHEIDQGILFNAILADRQCGLDLCHAMLLPRREALELAPKFARDGIVDLGTAKVERRGKATTVWMNNPRFLNAEDESTLPHVETAVDLALLDGGTEIAVLRGAPIAGGKYDGQRVFSSGINLTHLYQGRISYLWYLIRETGFVNKMFRGLACEHITPDEVSGSSCEKPWVGAVEKFAIGGGCQYLLALDFTVAESDAYMTLPARKEGIIPGVANMRLPRFVGDRIARQAIQYERRIDCDTPEGRMICDRIVAPGEMDAALDEVTVRLTSSGVVSAASNRRAFRVAVEPLDLFRRYMAVYAREQADCHFSPALIGNLERYWNAQNRKI